MWHTLILEETEDDENEAGQTDNSMRHQER